MWKLFMRLMAPADDQGGGGGGAGAGAGSGAGDGKGGAGDGKGAADDKGGILSSGKGAGAGAGDDKGGKPGAGAGTGDGGDKPWNWAENAPGTGTIPPWFKADKYKTVDAQARAAVELEQKLGPAAELIGAPVGADGKPAAYALPDVKAVKELEGWEWDAEDPLLKAFNAEAAAMGLSQKAYDRVATMFAKTMAAQNEQAELQLSEALATLGPNVAERVTAVQQFVVAKIGQEGFDALDGVLGTNVEAYKAFEKIVGLSANDARLAGAGGSTGLGFTKADIQAEQFKTYDKGPLAGQRIYDHDAEHRKKVDGMWSQLFPGQDEQKVG